MNRPHLPDAIRGIREREPNTAMFMGIVDFSDTKTRFATFDENAHRARTLILGVTEVQRRGRLSGAGGSLDRIHG